jgi:hypothetical protein
MCVLLLATLGMSEKRELDKVEGKMDRDLHRMDRIDVKIAVRKYVRWLLYISFYSLVCIRGVLG